MKSFFTYYEEELQKDADMEEHRQISVFNPLAPGKCRRLLKRVGRMSKRSARKTASYVDRKKQFNKDRIAKSTQGTKRQKIRKKLGIGTKRSNFGIIKNRGRK